MMTFSNDDIFGISIGEYCEEQGISIDELIESVDTDIKILTARLVEIGDIMAPLFDAVYSVRQRKYIHRDRLLEWAQNN